MAMTNTTYDLKISITAKFPPRPEIVADAIEQMLGNFAIGWFDITVKASEEDGKTQQA